MKQKAFIIMLGVLFVMCFSVTGTWAAPYSATMAADTYDDGSGDPGVPTPKDTAVLQNIHDAINLLLGTAYTKNEEVDGLQYTLPDETWVDLSDEDFEGTYIAIGLTAANSNTLRVYSLDDPATHISVLGPFSGFTFLGDGSAGDPFPAAMSPAEISPGENFGWSLKSVGSTTNIWDSDPSLNIDELDHMLTYSLASLGGKSVWISIGEDEPFLYTFNKPYLITWEDKKFNAVTGTLGDEDYNDAMFLVDRVAPIPEPMSLMLLGSGLAAGLVGIRRKRS